MPLTCHITGSMFFPNGYNITTLNNALGSVEAYSKFSCTYSVFSPASAHPPLLLIQIGTSSVTPSHQPFEVSSVAVKPSLIISIAANPFSKTLTLRICLTEFWHLIVHCTMFLNNFMCLLFLRNQGSPGKLGACLYFHRSQLTIGAR